MANTGYTLPGTAASETISGGNPDDWIDTNNILADDSNEAYLDYSTASSDVGAYIKATNFGFAIPGTATIDGVEMRYRRREVSGTDNVSTSRCRIIKGGTIHSANVSTMNTSEWAQAGSEAGSETITEGGPTNLWGVTLTPSDVNASDFGIAISPDMSGTTPDARIDFIQVDVYYTESAGGTVFVAKVIFF